MPISWNEVKSRAVSFSYDWKDAASEKSEAQSFLIEFLHIFGVIRKQVAFFEQKVKKLNNASGYIDLLWPGKLLVEMKSKKEDLHLAYLQALEYCDGLESHELPNLIMICDFHNFHIYKTDGTVSKFEIGDLLLNLKIFEELAGYQKRTYFEQDPVNIAAAELMGKLHDQLKEVGYSGTFLEVYLVRLLFILFADDTAIFQSSIFYDYLDQRTKEDGSDLAMHIDQIFQILNSPEDKRLTTLDEQLNLFPYVNGGLFAERLPTAAFNNKMRQILLDCCKLDWGKISPAIFGSMFQSVMNSTERRNLGAHYTSEKNILKLIKPLFLDEIWDEFHQCGENHNKLRELHRKISKLRFLDPACGCGNFLIISYKELRILELAIVEKLLKGQLVTNISQYFLVNLNQFYGIEIGEFASQIATVAMFLIDHQCNMIISERFGEYIPLIPLKTSSVIVNENSLGIDWQNIIKPFEGEIEEPKFDYILGNPPFVGSKLMNELQRNEVIKSFYGVDGAGVLDYVCGWYKKAADYIRINKTEAAFVSTNSITQGEQVGILWHHLLSDGQVKISFAHQTFKWSNEAKGNAAVYCVILGLSTQNKSRILYTYSNPKAEPIKEVVSNINPYLVEGKNIFLRSRQKPICPVHNMSFGNMPLDGGHLLLSNTEYQEFILREPKAIKFIKPLISAREFLNGEKRWCLWLVDASPAELKSMPLVLERLNKVREFRKASKAPSTQKFAETPSLFRDRNNPDSTIVIPRVSSENRKFIPMGFFTKESIVSDTCMSLPGGGHFDFGILSSTIHMTWVRYTCGRLKSDFRYSKDIVYNNYPWPESPTEKQKQAVEEAAQAVLDARVQFPDSSLADLYDPNTMPPALVKAHQKLDKAVDLCYRLQPFTSEAKRIEYLFELYEKYTAGLFQPEKKSNKTKN